MAQRTRGDAGPSHTGRVGDGELGEKQILRPDKDGFKNLYADLDKKWELSRRPLGYIRQLKTQADVQLGIYLLGDVEKFLIWMILVLIVGGLGHAVWVQVPRIVAWLSQLARK